MKKYQYVRVLTIASSDSGGGAGIQADLKTFSALGCYGASAIAAITVQNTLGVSAIHGIPPDIVEGQIRLVMDDIRPSAIKIGMVHSAEIASVIARTLKDYPQVPVILDPVMVASSGDKLMLDETVDVLRKELFPLAALVTPNLDEAEILAGMEVRSVAVMHYAAAQILSATGCGAVLVKGGHLKGNTLQDVYLARNGETFVLSSEAIDTANTHGTGCSLSSAIAAFVARGLSLTDAVKEAVRYIHSAIEEGRDVKTGVGHGPLNHFFNPQKQIKNEME